jgi:hypothetical protein
MNEAWAGFAYSEFMSMPMTRRYRLIEKKLELERDRKARNQSAGRR